MPILRADRSSFLAAARHGAVLLPTGLAAAGAALAGRPGAARRWPGSARSGRTLGAAVATALLGLLALVPLGLLLLFLLRGILYGVLDPGPYEDAWGGPTRAGAWLVHFVLSVPLAAAGLVALALLGRLHRRLTARLDRRPACR